MPKFISDSEMNALETGAPIASKNFISDDEMNTLESSSSDSKPEAEPESSFVRSALEGLAAAARAVDSYTGAPVRKSIGALQDGKGVLASLSDGAKQFGENPDLAPTGQQIAQKAGVSDAPLKKKQPWEDQSYEDMAMMDPMMAAQASGLSNTLSNLSRSGTAGFGIDMAADLTNVIPAGALVKKGVQAGAKSAGKVVRGAADAADAVFKGAGKVGKRVVQGGFGVPEEAITRYLARHPVLKDKVGAREMAEELAGKLNQGLKPVRDRLETAESALAAAKAKRSEDLAEVLLKRQEAKDALKLAEEQALGEAAARVSTRVQQLDKGVSEGSAKAFDILDKEGIRVPTKKLLMDMDAGAKALAERAVTREQKLVADLVKEYADNLRSAYPMDIPGGEAKRLLQSLDREMKQLAPGEIGRLSKEDQALGSLRRRIDASLKKSEAYAAQMKPVAEDTRLLMQTKDLASESTAARWLRAAARATGKDQAALLQALEARFGDKFLDAVQRSNLPEYAKLKGVLQRQRAIRKGGIVKDAERSLQALRDDVGEAAGLADHGVAGITDSISSYVRASQPRARQAEVLKKAGDLSGINMLDELADVKTISAFEKGFNRGSANTNVWGAIVGGLGGSVFGPSGALSGAAAGASFGRVIIDNFGPRVGRLILDAAPTLQKMNPSDWIRSLDVPSEVKARLAQDLAAYSGITRATRTAAASAKALGASRMKNVAESEEGPKGGPDRWARSGLERLGIQGELANQLLQSREGKRLLIEASDLPAGSKRLQTILKQIQGMENNYGNELGAVSSSKVLRRERQPSSGR